jgi:dUTP pyrophosphatase
MWHKINTNQMLVFTFVLFFIFLSLAYALLRAVDMFFLPHHPVQFYSKVKSTCVPKRTSPDAVCWDLYAAKAYKIEPGQTEMVDTGFVIIPPPKNYVRVESRSSMAFQGAHVVTHVVDPDYRGTVKVFIHNSTRYPLNIHHNQAVAQFSLSPYTIAPVKIVYERPQYAGRHDRYA